MKRKDPMQRERARRNLETDNPQDPYELREKPAGPAQCTGCGAVFERGRWAWVAAPAHARPALCAACRRIREKQPAGYVHLAGEFLAAHKSEIMHLLTNKEAAEKARHPLQRIMAVHETRDGLEITTTDVHLARGLGEALRHAYQGQLEEQNPKGDYSVRVYWNR